MILVCQQCSYIYNQIVGKKSLKSLGRKGDEGKIWEKENGWVRFEKKRKNLDNSAADFIRKR